MTYISFSRVLCAAAALTVGLLGSSVAEAQVYYAAPAPVAYFYQPVAVVPQYVYVPAPVVVAPAPVIAVPVPARVALRTAYAPVAPIAVSPAPVAAAAPVVVAPVVPRYFNQVNTRPGLFRGQREQITVTPYGTRYRYRDTRLLGPDYIYEYRETPLGVRVIERRGL